MSIEGGAAHQHRTSAGGSLQSLRRPPAGGSWTAVVGKCGVAGGQGRDAGAPPGAAAPSKISLLHLLQGVVHGAGGEGHVGERGVLATGGDHCGAVGAEDVGRAPELVFRFSRPSGVQGVTYGAEWSASLLPGTWTDIPSTGTLENPEFRITTARKASLFMRLKVIAD